MAFGRGRQRKPEAAEVVVLVVVAVPAAVVLLQLERAESCRAGNETGFCELNTALRG